MRKIWEFKVEYIRTGELDSRFHYFSARTYVEALGYHEDAIARHGNGVDVLSVKRKCPYRNKWVTEDQDDLFND